MMEHGPYTLKREEPENPEVNRPFTGGFIKIIVIRRMSSFPPMTQDEHLA